MGRQDEAELHLRSAVRLGIEALGEGQLDTVGYQTNLALALLARGNADEAETLLRRARFVVERQPGASGNQLGMISAELSAVAIVHNKLAIAAEDARKALAILSRQQWPDRRAIALAQVNLADVHMRANRLVEAESLLNEAIPSERNVAPDSRLLADGVRRMAQLRVRQERWREASEGTLVLRIADNGVGLKDPSAKSDPPRIAATKPGYQGMGLTITRGRLESLYGAQQSLTLKNVQTGGVEARITMPLRTLMEHSGTEHNPNPKQGHPGQNHVELQNTDR